MFFFLIAVVSFTYIREKKFSDPEVQIYYTNLSYSSIRLI